MMAPPIAYGTAIRKPAKMYGTAAGNTMWRATWRSLAPAIAHLHELGIERAHARQGVEIDDEENHARHQRDLRFDSDAEPSMNSGANNDLGGAITADHERVEDGDDERMAAQQERQQHRRHAADHGATTNSQIV